MNNNEILNFNGSDIKIKDILEKPTKEILIALYIETQDLKKSNDRVCDKVNGIDKKIDNQWSKIGKNNSAISRISGILCVLIPIILGIIGYIAYTR